MSIGLQDRECSRRGIYPVACCKPDTDCDCRVGEMHRSTCPAYKRITDEMGYSTHLYGSHNANRSTLAVPERTHSRVSFVPGFPMYPNGCPIL